MLKSVKRGMVAVGIATTIVAVGVATASAATFTVTAGTTTTGSTTYTGSTTGTSPQITFKDTTTGTSLTCASGTAKGAIPHLGTGLSNPLATVTGTTWTTCTGPFGLVLIPSQPAGSVWNLNGTGYAAGVTTGYINNITANVTSNPAGTCAFTVTGAADGKYTNTGGTLAMAPVAGSGHTLAISGVSGCFNLLHNGDAATFTATYAITTPLGALTITSP